MTSEKDSIFWKKKEFISFLLSILVLFIHSYFAADVSGDSFISVVNHKVSYFFSRSITQFAVPMFFMMSGIAFFKGYDNTKYFAKIKNRLFTLIIPYLLWNTVWMLWEIVTSYVGREPYSLSLMSVLKGIFFYGCNFPFWFVFDLIVFSLSAPLIFLIVKNVYVGAASIILLSVLSLFGIHLPVAVFYSPIAVIFYLIGALIGYHFFHIASKRSSKTMQIASGIFLAVYVAAKNIVPREMHIENYLLQVVVYTLAAFCLWNVVDAFIERIKPRAIYRRSFAIYAMHLNVAIVILKVLSVCLPQSEWLEIPKFVIMAVLTLVIINLVCAFLERFLPGIYAILMGKSQKKKSSDS